MRHEERRREEAEPVARDAASSTELRWASDAPRRRCPGWRRSGPRRPRSRRRRAGRSATRPSTGAARRTVLLAVDRFAARRGDRRRRSTTVRSRIGDHGDRTEVRRRCGARELRWIGRRPSRSARLRARGRPGRRARPGTPARSRSMTAPRRSATVHLIPTEHVATAAAPPRPAPARREEQPPGHPTGSTRKPTPRSAVITIPPSSLRRSAATCASSVLVGAEPLPAPHVLDDLGAPTGRARVLAQEAQDVELLGREVHLAIRRGTPAGTRRSIRTVRPTTCGVVRPPSRARPRFASGARMRASSSRTLNGLTR